MNTVESTLTTADRALIDAWLTEIRDLHAKLSTPILEGDPRMETFRARNYSTQGLTPKELGESYFWALRPELPAWPLALPAWAERVEVLAGNYPEVAVRIIGKGWDVPNDAGEHYAARIEQFGTVFADDDDDMAEGGNIKCGDYQMGEPMIAIPTHADDLSVWDALSLAISINDAGTQLRNFLNG